MMQEAKSSCAGQWYLPAGRIEPGEEIEVGIKLKPLENTIHIFIYYILNIH